MESFPNASSPSSEGRPARPRARYRQIEVLELEDDAFLDLGDPARVLSIFLRFGPLTGPIPGLLRVGLADVSERLARPLAWVEEALAELVRAGLVTYDQRARLLWVPSHVHRYPPDSSKNVRAWGSAWAELRDCPTKRDAYLALRSWCELRGESFLEAFLEVVEAPAGESKTPSVRASDAPSDGRPDAPSDAKITDHRSGIQDHDLPPPLISDPGTNARAPGQAGGGGGTIPSGVTLGPVERSARRPAPEGRQDLAVGTLARQAVPIAEALRDAPQAPLLAEAGLLPGRTAADLYGRTVTRGVRKGVDLAVVARCALEVLSAACLGADHVPPPSRGQFLANAFVRLLDPEQLRKHLEGGDGRPRDAPASSSRGNRSRSPLPFAPNIPSTTALDAASEVARAQKNLERARLEAAQESEE